MPKHNQSDLPTEILTGVLGSFLANSMRSGGPGANFPFGAPTSHASHAQESRKPTQTSPVETILNPFFDFIHKTAGDVQDFIADTGGDAPQKPSEEKPSEKKTAPSQEAPRKATSETLPPMDIVDYDNKVEFRFSVAGLTSENVSVELEDGVLVVSITSPATSDEAGKYILKNIWSGNEGTTLRKGFPIPTVDATGRVREIDEANITATVKEGLFTVTVPFKGVRKTKITVQ